MGCQGRPLRLFVVRKKRQFDISDEDSLSLAKMNTNRCSHKTSRNQLCFVDIRFAYTSLRELCLIFELPLLFDVISTDEKMLYMTS